MAGRGRNALTARRTMSDGAAQLNDNIGRMTNPEGARGVGGVYAPGADTALRSIGAPLQRAQHIMGGGQQRPMDLIFSAAQKVLGRVPSDPQEAIDAAWQAQPTDEMGEAIDMMAQQLGDVRTPWAEQQERMQEMDDPTQPMMTGPRKGSVEPVEPRQRPR